MYRGLSATAITLEKKQQSSVDVGYFPFSSAISMLVETETPYLCHGSFLSGASYILLTGSRSDTELGGRNRESVNRTFSQRAKAWFRLVQRTKEWNAEKERKRRTIDSLESRNSFVATADPVSVTSAGTIGLFYT